jgi:hypothetical protein
MIKQFLISLLTILLALQAGFAQQPSSRELLDAAFAALASEKSWDSDVIGEKLTAIVVNHPTSQEAPTAKALLVSHLTQKGGTQNYNTALSSANAILASSPITWRHAWVAINKASILGFLNREQQAIEAAKWGLTVLDAAHLDQESDPDFVRLLQVTNEPRSSFKDSLLAILVTHLMVTGTAAEVDTYMNQVADATLRSKLQRLRTLQRE